MEKLRVTKLILLLAAAFMAPDAPAQSLPGWSLQWSDEFSQSEGSLPDATKWGYDIGGSGWGNNELQYYTNRPENARISGGQLVIEARAEAFGGRNHTSARLLTKNKASWTYGRMEARIKVPRGQGIWPAFWMLGTNIDSVGWPACGEIDIMENIGREPSKLHGTVHGPGYSGGNGISGSTVLAGAALADDFHVYAIEWEAGRITWFLDGQQYFSITPASLPGGSAWVFNQPQFLILNVAVGGNWPGNPDGTTVFPQRMTVDYVRVYTPAAAGTAGTNVLINPGFETVSPLSWTTVGGNVYLESTASRAGARSMKVFGSFSGVANDSGASQQIATLPGDRYAADAWLLTPSGDKIAGTNSAWVEVSFRDASSNVLALYRSPVMNSASVAGTWQNFAVTQQVNPTTGALIGTVTALVAPSGTTTVRKQLVFRQPANAGGSVWFDDMNLFKNVAASAPTISDIANLSIPEDTATAAIPFTVGDLETAAAALTVSAASSNTALVPLANIVLGGSAANRTVTLTPAADQSGSATITITVSDGVLSSSDSFVLTVTAVNAAPTNPVVSVDPAETWLGYMNVSDLPADGGTVRSGGLWGIADLNSSFSGNTLRLSPNTIGDPAAYWYVSEDGMIKSGNKIMGANLYVEKNGIFSGKNVTFSGRVSANTLTSAHRTVAFIRDFSSDYSSSNSVSVPLSNGVFSIRLGTLPGADRRVQYGFETTGVNVWSTQVGPFGNIQITAFIGASFDSWMNSYNFSGFENPDLTPSGDPDGDGRNNLLEFSLDGNPASGADPNKIGNSFEGAGADQFLRFTLPVLEGAVFSGSLSKSSNIGGVNYTIEGSNNLSTFDQEISEVLPPSAQGMPTLRDGWAYRTFRLVSPLPGPNPAGFMRVKLVEAPF
jgi:beta-glucanase (GH16 family)